jgi:hypothetical protein
MHQLQARPIPQLNHANAQYNPLMFGTEYIELLASNEPARLYLFHRSRSVRLDDFAPCLDRRQFRSVGFNR